MSGSAHGIEIRFTRSHRKLGILLTSAEHATRALRILVLAAVKALTFIDALAAGVRLRVHKAPIDRANEQISEIEARLRDPNREMAAMQFAARPRRLSNQQREIIRAQVALIPAEIEIGHVLGDSESHDYAMDFLNVFKEAGWKAKGPTQVMRSGKPEPTLLTVSNFDDPAPAERAIIRGLNSIGSRPIVNGTQRFQCTQLFVGPRGAKLLETPLRAITEAGTERNLRARRAPTPVAFKLTATVKCEA